ncbi:MAG: hypothetical protein WDO15_27180 [Bacteroidota bacterium]
MIEKGGLLKQYASIGIGNTIQTAHVVGIIEIVGALLILVRPLGYIVLAFFIWKMTSEVLYPAYPFFEWVERGGSYGVLLGLWMMLYSGFNLKQMNKIPVVALLLILLVNVRCSSNSSSDKLSDAEVERLLTTANAYPHTMEAEFFINTEATAGKVYRQRLDENGYVTVQPRHTKDDVGQSLVHFTEKAAPYLLAKPDSVESIEIQLVKVGDEIFSKVISIAYSGDQKEAQVVYEVKIENPTPFTPVLRPEMQPVQYRQTTFTRSQEGWQWAKDYCECPQAEVAALL